MGLLPGQQRGNGAPVQKKGALGDGEPIGVPELVPESVCPPRIAVFSLDLAWGVQRWKTLQGMAHRVWVKSHAFLFFFKKRGSPAGTSGRPRIGWPRF